MEAPLGPATFTIRAKVPGQPDQTVAVQLMVLTAVHTVEIEPALPQLEYDQVLEVSVSP